IGGAHDGEIMAPGIGGSGVLAWPLPIAGSISSPFGYRKDPFSGKWSFHRGLDIAAPNGTPILAAADGIVVVANATDSWGYSWGYYVKIQHPKGMTTLYAHCSVIAASAGQQVQRGEVIAYVGNTGASTGNHLHFEVTDDGRLVNALNYFTA
ncbi:MAG: M23 family metallopeptidase, partial [Anaerovoracaceae bacterium]